MTRFGVVEALYLTELVGLVMIFIGYRLSVSTRPTEAASCGRRGLASSRLTGGTRRTRLPIIGRGGARPLRWGLPDWGIGRCRSGRDAGHSVTDHPTT